MNLSRLGCKRPKAPPHTHRMSFRMHSFPGGFYPACDLRETRLVADVKDQGSTSSCEGHACSGATETAFALLDRPLGFIPSEQWMYAGGRAIDRGRRTPWSSTLPPLRDEGAYTEDVIGFMSSFGIRPRSIVRTSDGRNSDVEAKTVNREPTLGDLEDGALNIVVGPYAIDPQASDAEAQVKTAICMRIPIRVDVFVDSVFEDWSPSKPPIPAPNEKDPNGGGHAMYVVGYDVSSYIVRNSWGTSWGDGGDVRVSPEWMRTAWGIYPWVVAMAGGAP